MISFKLSLPVMCRDFRLSPCLTSRPWKSAYCV